MPSVVQWSRDPNMWRVRGKLLGLRAAIDESRSILIKSVQQRMLRDYARLCNRWRALLADCRIAQQMNDSAAIQRLANEIATFYRQLGAFEVALDSTLAEADGTEPRVGLRTG